MIQNQLVNFNGRKQEGWHLHTFDINVLKRDPTDSSGSINFHYENMRVTRMVVRWLQGVAGRIQKEKERKERQ